MALKAVYEQPRSLPCLANEAERIRQRHGGRGGIPGVFDPIVLVSEAPELPLFLWQVLVSLALGLKDLTETDCLAA